MINWSWAEGCDVNDNDDDEKSSDKKDDHYLLFSNMFNSDRDQHCYTLLLLSTDWSWLTKNSCTDYCKQLDHHFGDDDDDGDDDAGGDDGDDDDMMMTMMIMRMKLLLATNGSWPTKTSHTSQSVMDYCKQLDHDHDHDLGEW